MEPNPNKTKALVVSRSRTVCPPPHRDLVLSVVSIGTSPSLDILGMKFASRLTFEYHVRGIVSRVSWRICILRLVKRIFLDTSVLLRSLSIVLRCEGQLLNVTFSFLSARYIRWPGFVPISFLSLCHHVVWLGLVCCRRLTRTLITRHPRAAAAAHLLELEVLRYRMSQFARSFLPAQVRLWNDLPYTVFDTYMLDGFKGAVNRWLLP